MPAGSQVQATVPARQVHFVSRIDLLFMINFCQFFWSDHSGGRCNRSRKDRTDHLLLGMDGTGSGSHSQRSASGSHPWLPEPVGSVCTSRIAGSCLAVAQDQTTSVPTTANRVILSDLAVLQHVSSIVVARPTRRILACPRSVIKELSHYEIERAFPAGFRQTRMASLTLHHARIQRGWLNPLSSNPSGRHVTAEAVPGRVLCAG